jgi:two-component system sensor histidine kinase TctE
LTHLANKVVLEVVDNGIGIPLNRREQVFHRFYRVEDNVGDGCGLGLAIVNEIILAHQAHIYIKNGLPHIEKNGEVAFGTNMTVQFEKV